MDGKPLPVVVRVWDKEPVYRQQSRDQAELNRRYFAIRSDLQSMRLRDFCRSLGIDINDVVV